MQDDDGEGDGVVGGAAGAPAPLRGAGEAGVHSGNSELRASSRSCPMASSRLPAGRPADTCARSEGLRSSSRMSSQSSFVSVWP